MEEGQLLLDNHHPVAGCRRLLSKHETAIFSAGLMMLLALERLAFKVMVDRMAPFRFVLPQAVALCFALAIGLVLLYRFAFLGARWTLGSFPKRHLVIVAFLDMLHLVPVIVAAADVAPTLTVLLIQCSAPFCIATGTLFCMKRYSRKAVSGAVIISIGACIAMYLPISNLVKALMANGPMRHLQDNAVVEGYNTLLYLAACIPGAISTMYKQYAMEEHGGNIDALQMSLGVAVFQLVFITLATPVAYRLQYLGRHVDEHAGAIEGLLGGWRCLVTMSGGEDLDGYPGEANCSAGLPVVLLYVVSTLVVSPMAQKIVDVNNSHTVYHRVMTLSVPTAFFVLCLYDPLIWLLDSLNVYTVAGLVIILYGLSLYHTVTEADNNRDNFQPPAAPSTSTTSATPDGKRFG